MKIIKGKKLVISTLFNISFHVELEGNIFGRAINLQVSLLKLNALTVTVWGPQKPLRSPSRPKNALSSCWIITVTLYTAGATKLWIDQSGFSRREKLYCPDFNVCFTEKVLKSGNFCHWRRHWVFTKRVYNSKHHIRLEKVENMKHFVSQIE